MAKLTLLNERKGIQDKINFLNTKIEQLVKNKKHFNNIVDVISLCENENEKIQLCCIKGLHKIFNHIITGKEMCMSSTEEQEDSTPDVELKKWLGERYNDAQERLLELLLSENPAVKELALCTLMKFIELEGKHPFNKGHRKEPGFPEALLKKILYALLSFERDTSETISRFKEYLEYGDVKYHTMKTVHLLIKSKQEKKIPDCGLRNIHTLLENLSMKQNASSDEEYTRLCTSDASSSKKYSHKMQKKAFSALWLEFLKRKLPTSLFKKILLNLHDSVIPHMTSPLMLSDFLTRSYDIGGAISLLALNGLFLLVHNYNLDYPDFYKKLYALFEPSVFHVKYRARFFYLADLFLTSRHIPAYLAAAFAKRLSRLTLTAPPDGLVIIVPFIYNLIYRHPTLHCLLHREADTINEGSDPFLFDESDPIKCQAMESSLWEIKTLQTHYHHSISITANKINTAFPKADADLSDLLDTTTDKMFTEERNKKMKEVPLCYDTPKGLFGNKEDKFNNLWTISDLSDEVITLD